MKQLHATCNFMIINNSFSKTFPSPPPRPPPPPQKKAFLAYLATTVSRLSWKAYSRTPYAGLALRTNRASLLCETDSDNNLFSHFFNPFILRKSQILQANDWNFFLFLCLTANSLFVLLFSGFLPFKP